MGDLNLYQVKDIVFAFLLFYIFLTQRFQLQSLTMKVHICYTKVFLKAICGVNCVVGKEAYILVPDRYIGTILVLAMKKKLANKEYSYLTNKNMLYCFLITGY